MDNEKKLLDELKQIKQFTMMQAQINKDLLNEIRGLREDIRKWQA